MKSLTLAQKTFIGRRSNNQDSCSARKIKEGVYFLAVADGMGGSVGGQIANKLVLDNALKIIMEEFNYEMPPSEMKEVLQRVFISSQQKIAQKIKEEPSLMGMGTTLTCVLIQDDKYVWGNIGDSRTYLLRNNDLRPITIDHTYVQDFINESGGKALPQNVLKQYGNYLQRALDGGTDQADIFPNDKDFERLVEGDIFFLCSDGLILDKVESDTTIFRNYILGSKNLQDAAEQLIALVFHDGSKDNISTVLASYANYKRIKTKIKKFTYPPKETEKDKSKKIFSSPRLSTIIGVSAILVTLLLAYVLIIKPDQQKIFDILNFFGENSKETKATPTKKAALKNDNSELKEFKNIDEIIGEKLPIVKNLVKQKSKVVNEKKTTIVSNLTKDVKPNKIENKKTSGQQTNLKQNITPIPETTKVRDDLIKETPKKRNAKK